MNKLYFKTRNILFPSSFNFFKSVNKRFNTSNTQLDPNLKEDNHPLKGWKDLQDLSPYEIGLTQIRDQINEVYKYSKQDRTSFHEWEIPTHLRKINNSFTVSVDSHFIFFMLKSYANLLDTKTVFHKFRMLAEIKDLTHQETFTVFLPYIKSHIKKFDRQNIQELSEAAIAGSMAYIADNEFWMVIEGKLVTEKLYRYLSLEESAELAYYLKKADKGSSILHKILEVEFINQRKALSKQKKLLKLVKEAYVDTGVASEVLIAALNDPNIEVTKTEKLH